MPAPPPVRASHQRWAARISAAARSARAASRDAARAEAQAKHYADVAKHLRELEARRLDELAVLRGDKP